MADYIARIQNFMIMCRFEGVDESTEIISFSSKKLIDLGFEYKHNLEEMYEDAIQSCREKGLLPHASEGGKPAGSRK